MRRPYPHKIIPRGVSTFGFICGLLWLRDGSGRHFPERAPERVFITVSTEFVRGLDELLTLSLAIFRSFGFRHRVPHAGPSTLTMLRRSSCLEGFLARKTISSGIIALCSHTESAFLNPKAAPFLGGLWGRGGMVDTSDFKSAA